MIIAPASKQCEMCGDIAIIQWSSDGVEWHWGNEKAPPSNDVRLRLQCPNCLTIEDPFADPEVKHFFNLMKYGIITSMISAGLYRYP